MCVFYTFQQTEDKESKFYTFLEALRTGNFPEKQNNFKIYNDNDDNKDINCLSFQGEETEGRLRCSCFFSNTSPAP